MRRIFLVITFEYRSSFYLGMPSTIKAEKLRLGFMDLDKSTGRNVTDFLGR